MKSYAYHQWSVPDVERHFDVKQKEGLNSREVERRLDKYGKNTLAGFSETSIYIIFFRQLTNFFVILLVLSMIISFWIGNLTQGIILLVIVIFNIAISFYQEFKAEKSLSVLKQSYSSKAKVIRNGEISEIDSSELVPGDIVVLSAGDKVPADLRIFEEDGLRVNEAELTGESLPVSKTNTPVEIDAALGDRLCLAFAGTHVIVGSGDGIVVSTGANTEFGKIAALVSKKDEKTPLEKKVLYIGRIFSYIVIFISILVFVSGLIQGWDFIEIFTYVIAFLVAAVPESLPTVVTLSLAVGVMDMVKKKAIVRRLSVVEALGSVNVIVTDKTGTLTKNELSIHQFGIFKNGKISKIRAGKGTSDEENRILYYASLASDISGENDGVFYGDPLEVAILSKLYKSDKKRFGLWQKFERSSYLPFDSAKKYVLVSGKAGSKQWMTLKGAVETTINFCDLEKSEIAQVKATADEFNNDGLKTILVCRKEIDKNTASDLKNFEFLGLIGFLDEPIPGIEKAIEASIKAGIRPIMVTGDHPNTAMYIANKVGFRVRPDEILRGDQIEKLSDSALKKILSKIKVFARVTPEDKIKIVELLEQQGYIVAVTGDGVNDAPALKAATVGIAMGIRGSDVARDAADIVLSDDNYGTIIKAIEYGRTIYDNIKNALVFLLASNFVELFLIGLCFSLRLPAPLLAIQILWINLITDSIPAIALAFEKPSAEVLSEPPRSGKEQSISSSLLYASILGAISLIVCAILYLWGLHGSIAKARTLVFLTIIASQMFLALSIRSKIRIWENPLNFFSNIYLNFAVLIALALQLLTMLPGTRAVFGVALLDYRDIVGIIISVVFVFATAEIVRYFFDKRTKERKNKKIE